MYDMEEVETVALDLLDVARDAVTVLNWLIGNLPPHEWPAQMYDHPARLAAARAAVKRAEDLGLHLMDCPACAEGMVWPGATVGMWAGQVPWPEDLQPEPCDLCNGTGAVLVRVAEEYEADQAADLCPHNEDPAFCNECRGGQAEALGL